jgi:membrane protease YdiL (CAAX protease family)
MKRKLLQILLWLGAMSVLTAIAMGAWMIIWGGSQSTESLKWLQFIQTTATFLIPPILCAWLWDEEHKPFRWLRMDVPVQWQNILLAVVIMLCAVPGINLLADLNSRVELPKSLEFIEQILKSQEEAAAALTERFLQADNIGGLLLNIGLMALLPALSEELSFRGTLQQIIYKEQSGKVQSTKVHLAIWITAFIFSAIHMQFYGFVPRMLLGAMFGYVFVWSGSLWVPITMHFVNNGLAVLVYYLMGESENTKNIADTLGAGDTWYLGIFSILITSLGLLIFYRRTHKQ